jgi:hypothetical protein
MPTALAPLFSIQRLLILGLGLLSMVTMLLGGARTGATFAAQTVSPNNSLTLGSLVLSTTATSGGSACLSAQAGTDTNQNPSCGTLLTLGGMRPGDVTFVTVAVKNAGTVSGSLRLFSPACTSSAAQGGGTAAGKNLCDVLQFYVQETDAPAGAQVACFYASACTFADDTRTLGAFVGADKHTTAATGLDLGSVDGGATRYFRIGVRLAPNRAQIDDSVQGQKATFDLAWQMAQ